MSREITQADADEIVEFCKTHPNVRIVQDEDLGWSVRIADGKNFYAEIHPLSFLDLLHDTAPDDDVLKAL